MAHASPQPMYDDLFTACSGAALVVSAVLQRIARGTRSRASSARAALLDATLARYIEILVLGGLAFLLRSSSTPFVLSLLVLLGVLLMGYADTKAHALGVTGSWQLDVGGSGATPAPLRFATFGGHPFVVGLSLALAPRLWALMHLPSSLGTVFALLTVGAGANVVAVWRLREVAALLSNRAPPPLTSNVRHSLLARFLAAFHRA